MSAKEARGMAARQLAEHETAPVLAVDLTLLPTEHSQSNRVTPSSAISP